MDKLTKALAELQEADLITRKELKGLFQPSDVVEVQSGKSPEVQTEAADVLRRHGFEKESDVLAVLAELQEADLITSKECKGLRQPSDVVEVHRSKSPEVQTKTADILRTHGFKEESNFLAVLAELQQADLITSQECEGLYNQSIVVKVQSGKSPEVQDETAFILKRNGFEKEFHFLAVLAELQQAGLITSEESNGLMYPSRVVRVQRGKSPQVLTESANVFRTHGFVEESNFLAVLAELQQADLITSEECNELVYPSHVVAVQRGKSPEIQIRTADILRRHGFEKPSNLLAVGSRQERREKQHGPSQAFSTAVDSERIPTVFCWKYGGRDVCVYCSATGWKAKLPLKKSDHGDFSATTELPEGRHEYKFIVDGEWRHDPYAETVCNDLGSISNVLHVTRQGVDASQSSDIRNLSKSVRAVLADLQKARVMTGFESVKLRDPVSVVKVQSKKSSEVMVITADILRANGFADEAQTLIVLAKLQQADLITSKECSEANAVGGKGLSRVSDVIRIQSKKSHDMITKTAEVLRGRGFERESEFLSVCVALDLLQEADLITSEETERLKAGFNEERKKLTNFSDVIGVQSGKSSAVIMKSAGVLRKHGFDNVSQILEVRAILADLQEHRVMTSFESKELRDISGVVRAQSKKSPEEMVTTADILESHGFEKESKVLSDHACLAKLLREELITREENQMLREPSDVVRMQRTKPPEVMARTAQVLVAHGFEKESRVLSVLADLHNAGLVATDERERLSDISDVVRVQRGKSPAKVAKAADILKEYGFEEQSVFLSVLAQLQHARLISREECKGLSDTSGVITVQSGKSDAVLRKSANVLKKLGFKEESAFLSVLAELQQAGLITSEECKGLSYPIHVVKVQSGKSPEVQTKTADILRKHGFEKQSPHLAVLKRTESQLADKEASLDVKVTQKDKPWDYDADEEFKQRYLEAVRTQASVTLKITKCTTIGPPRKGKTCLKYLLTGRKWNVDAGTASTDIMEAPEWVECYGLEEEGAEELWKLVPEDEQRKKVIWAVSSLNARPKTTLSGDLPSPPVKASTLPFSVSGSRPPHMVNDPPHPPSVSGSPHPPFVSGSTHPPSVSGSPHPPSVSGSRPPHKVSGSPHPTSVSGSPHPTSVSGSRPPHTVSGSPHPPSVSGSPHPPSVSGSQLPHTHKHSGSLHPATPTDTSHSDGRAQTLMQGIKALANTFNPEDLKDVLKDKKGKVLGETQLIHFVDTGGQAIYHDIHPVLINSPSVYLVVLSLEDLKNDGLEYFRSELVQRPLESICAFGTKSLPDKSLLEFHPDVPRIFIVGTHLDKIPLERREQFLQEVHEMMDKEISSKPYRQFVQFDTNGRSFWAVDNTQAGRDQDESVRKYISKLRQMVQDGSMEMSVDIPLTWMLLKVVMEGKVVRYCKYSELLDEAHKLGYVREDSPDADLDTMLRLFHILSLFYHKVPKRCKKEDSLVFIDPDCLFSATSDFLMAAKEEIMDGQGGSGEDNQHQSHAASKGVKMAGDLQLKNTVGKQRVGQRMEENAASIKREVEDKVLPIVNEAKMRMGHSQESIEKELTLLHAKLKKKGQEYKIPPGESQDASSVKAKRQLFIGRLLHSLVSSVEALLHSLGTKRDVQKEIEKAVKKITTLYESRSINYSDMDQFLSILSDLRIVAKLSSSGNYVVPAALPQRQKQGEVFNSTKLKGPADPILFTMVSQTAMEVCYLPSCLFCCLINELVTGLGWTVDPLERTHVAFTHEGLTGRVHMMEHSSYIEIKVESHLPLSQINQTCQTVRRSVCESIVQLYKNLYSGPTSHPVWEESLVWGFKCQEEHAEDDASIAPHIAAFRQDGSQLWKECVLEPWNVQDVEETQLAWFSSLS